MHNIALELKELYQHWAYDSRTGVENPALKCCDQAGMRLDSKELHQASNPSSLPVQLSESTEAMTRVVNDIAFPRETE